MTTSPILVDSSWYIRQTQQKNDPFEILSTYSQYRSVAVCGIIIVEVGRGVREEKFRRKHDHAWAKMVWIESTKEIWEHTMELAWQLDRAGTPLPLPDIHIASCALSIGAVILTHDQHFKRIPGVLATDRIY